MWHRCTLFRVNIISGPSQLIFPLHSHPDLFPPKVMEASCRDVIQPVSFSAVNRLPERFGDETFSIEGVNQRFSKVSLCVFLRRRERAVKNNEVWKYWPGWLRSVWKPEGLDFLWGRRMLELHERQCGDISCCTSLMFTWICCEGLPLGWIIQHEALLSVWNNNRCAVSSSSSRCKCFLKNGVYVTLEPLQTRFMITESLIVYDPLTFSLRFSYTSFCVSVLSVFKAFSGLQIWWDRPKTSHFLGHTFCRAVDVH